MNGPVKRQGEKAEPDANRHMKQAVQEKHVRRIPRTRYSSMTFLNICTKWGLFFDSVSSLAFLSASLR